MTMAELCMTYTLRRGKENVGSFGPKKGIACADLASLVVFINCYSFKSFLSARSLYNMSFRAPSCEMRAVSDGLYALDNLHSALCFEKLAEFTVCRRQSLSCSYLESVTP